MNSDSDTEYLIEKESSDEEFSSSESESDDDFRKGDWQQYAESHFQNAELTPSSRALKWKNINNQEMKDLYLFCYYKA
ncbi:hypothetical protein AVEN_258704-1 [Araneus ventricosus]|uniref:Uncharacterized protein n=1 Tax=Araneus ventricosus TaxID=182803 RepID=A0A4Y2RT87_ARAVE|nr:hypothetical protein AVEN_258704-1 [Araneus ventricosus]